ncbi:class I SAM-dependent methyltransferase [Cohnella mopanensis]|uniref:class I SAM-dependent methyltransferase n=1 Tax=Cohnella mopanensis TaxID=2911966 RepID=UPI001EF79DA6|nr:hypothetical protein [Cohnella mopanensis]
MKMPIFFNEFLQHSDQVGNVIPSTGFLVRKMLPPAVPWHKIEQIAELGPGKGMFTRHIERERRASSRLFLFEKNDRFRDNLKIRFPRLQVLDDALKLGNVVYETGKPFDLIVSALPFANYPLELQANLFRVIHDALAANGTFIALQYTLRLQCKFEAFFPVMEMGYTWMNFPPAWVFKCKKP